MRFCTCDFKWNWAGWRKAFTLWNFVLTTALGLQKLAIKIGLNGLLPGRQQIFGFVQLSAAMRQRALADVFPSQDLHTSGFGQGRAPMILLQKAVSPLAGEEVVTKESFVSVCWRLIPYWLNNWEQQWGAECSSMMFELPHFAIELLVVLPCVQVRLIGLVTQQAFSALCIHQPLSDPHGEGPQTCSKVNNVSDDSEFDMCILCRYFAHA